MVDRRILELEATRDLSRIWLHVDMDAFYAAVETLSDPSLKGKPMAVGGLSMISTANYEVGCGFQLVDKQFARAYAYSLYSLLNSTISLRRGSLGSVQQCLASLLVNCVHI